jgi:hypothetical protein
VTIADTIWLATALLEKENPRAAGFSYETILEKVSDLDATLKPGSVHAHLSAHCIASKRASPATLRILTENPDGTLRLFRLGDHYHGTRRVGRTQPKPHAIPSEYHSLLQPEDNLAEPFRFLPEEDPILALTGVGKEMWKRLGGGEAFLRAVREDGPLVLPSRAKLQSSPFTNAIEKPTNGKSSKNGSGSPPKLPARPRSFDDVWPRIEAHAGEEFRTIRGKPFSYNIRGSAVVPRPGKATETNRLLPRSHFQKAWDRRPLSGPGQIHDLQGPAYVYAILTDPRICGR